MVIIYNYIYNIYMHTHIYIYTHTHTYTYMYIFILRRNLYTRTQCDPYRYHICFMHSFVRGDLG